MKIIRLLLAPLVALLVVLGLGGATAVSTAGSAAPPAGAATTRPAPTTANHFATNLDGDVAGPLRTGFTIFDTGDSLRQVRALPRGVEALVWLGQKCPTSAGKSFRKTVRRLAASPRVFGYYLSDEPHIVDCPKGPAALATRAKFIRKVSEGRQESFIVLSKDEDYRSFRPAVTKVSMIGLDPYPCSLAHPSCELRQINQAVRQATNRGISLRRIVPVYQAFGQKDTDDHYYNLPTAKQERKMIARWASLVPHPRMDYTYGWGHQGSSNPTLVDSRGLKKVFRTYFGG